MTIDGLEQVNKWAKKSCTKWNKNRLTRRHYREKYRNAAKEFWESSSFQEVIRFYKEMDRHTNTYPWPYRDENFANWEEDDTPEEYTLITDQSGCVIRYSTSYCAWKIFEATGVWPQKTSRERLDAKRWQQFLAEAGYTEIVDEPDCSQQRHYYVGIDPAYGEWGLTVWYETPSSDGNIMVSSYIDHQYVFFKTYANLYTWVKIK